MSRPWSGLFACDSNNKCFRDFAARHRAFADVERTDLRRERWRAILAYLLVTNSALGLLFKRKLELGIHERLQVGRLRHLTASAVSRHPPGHHVSKREPFVLAGIGATNAA
jgi:hypothetical protein